MGAGRLSLYGGAGRAAALPVGVDGGKPDRRSFFRRERVRVGAHEAGIFPGVSVLHGGGVVSGRAGLSGGAGPVCLGGDGADPGPVLHLYRRAGPGRDVGGYRDLRAGGRGGVPAGSAAAAVGTAHLRLAAGGGAGGAVAAGAGVCAVDVPPAPSAAVSGPTDGGIRRPARTRHVLKKRADR